MTYVNPDALVETEWLAANISDPKVRVLDSSYHLPGTGRDAETEFSDRHIPGAMLFDIEDVRDRDIPLPHMLPDAEQFAAQMSTLGISNDDMVVIYDVHGVQTSPRAWWTFRAFGHDKVAVLNGGLPKWLAEHRPVSDDIIDRERGEFKAQADTSLVRSVDQMLTNQESRGALVVDARPAGRFEGVDPEPRTGLRSGRMPGSVNLPINQLIDPVTKTFLPADGIRTVLADAGVSDLSQPMITSCGSGVAACVVSLGLYLIGNKAVPVYDGSWSEWGAREDTPVEV
ncbi:MAG: 3-mercaptopyruvate sulfurtransferase [Alphaproteobacteria bacterium]|nr:3-mercaptopyruvate sulfurtransferase [Alphaproteobacteria bacterium]